MTRIVIDSSIAMAWIAPDEHLPLIEPLSARVARDGGAVPALFWFEIANGLAMKTRRGRISQDEACAAYAFVVDVPLETHPFTGFEPIVQIAQNHALTAYDAAFLHLAQRLDSPLASLDRRLLAAAEAEGLKTFAA